MNRLLVLVIVGLFALAPTGHSPILRIGPEGTELAFAQPDESTTHQRWLDAINRGEVNTAVMLFTEDAVFDDGGGCRWPFMCVGPDEVQPQIATLVQKNTQIKVTDIRGFSTPWTRWTTAWFEVRSDSVRAAGVERILQATTVALRGDKIVSVTWRSNAGDEQTARFLAAQPRPVQPSLPRPAPAPNGRFIDLDGRKIYLECLGNGSPTVVFEAGFDPVGGASGRTWIGAEPRPRANRNIHANAAKVTRACTYDRAGIGLSDRGPTPRDGLSVVADLRSLLRRAGEQPPYVLVGFSLGGPLAYLFASQYRHEVAGLILLDPTLDFFGFNERLWAIFPPELVERDRQQTDRFYAQVASPRAFEGGWDWPATLAHLRGTPSLGDIPLVVLSAGIPLTNPYDTAPASLIGPQPGWSNDLTEKWQQLRLQVHADIAHRVPRGTHTVVDNSHHLMFRFVPERVTAAMLEVVRTVRSR